MITGVYCRTFILGHNYMVNNNPTYIVKFIKVTRKGFNLLDIKTNKCILSHHLYSKDWSGKEIPSHLKEIKNCWVRNDLFFKEVKQTQKI